MNYAHAQERVVVMMWRMALTRSLARLVNSCKLVFDFRILSAFDSFWRVVNKNSGWGEKEANDNLKRVFVLVSTSGASDWQAWEDSHWNKRTTFVFHKIVIYNPWTLKKSEYSLKISLTTKRSEFTGVQKLFLLWREIGDKIDHYISYRVVFLCEATKGAGDWRNYRLTRKSNNT